MQMSGRLHEVAQEKLRPSRVAEQTEYHVFRRNGRRRSRVDASDTGRDGGGNTSLEPDSRPWRGLLQKGGDQLPADTR